MFCTRPLRRWRQAAFSLVELMVVCLLSGLTIGAAATVFHASVKRSEQYRFIQDIPLGATLAANLYGVTFTNTSTNSVRVYAAPHLRTTEQAERLREIFLDDVGHGAAVFGYCRQDRNNWRPTRLSLPAGNDASQYDTPEKFYSLMAYNGIALGNFSVFGHGGWNGVKLTAGNAPNSAYCNASIFITQPGANDSDGNGSQAEDFNYVDIRAIWEIDFVRYSGANGQPRGILASVRRFRGTSLVEGCYYDIFYPTDVDPTTAANWETLWFGPPVVFFERSARALASGGNAYVEAFKQASDHPFYFLWWPDPSSSRLAETTAPTYAGSGTAIDPRSLYSRHEGQTHLFTVFPQFPAAR